MIIQKDLSGNVMGQYESLREAARQTNHGRRQITNAIRTSKIFKNSVWEDATSIQEEKPRINGIKAEENVDFESEILPLMMRVGHRAKEKNIKESEAQISIRGSQPFAIVPMSDVHGGGKTDYEAIQRDIDIVRSTPDMWAILAGDLTDNFIIGKLQAVQKHQPFPMNFEHRFLEWFIDNLKDSLIAFVSGNHDIWTHKTTAYDHLKEMLKDVDCLFNRNQVQFTLNYFGQSQKWLVRHKFKHNSIFNPTHGIEVAWERMGIDFDVAIAGHTHIATLHRPFVKHDKKRHAILLGTYKVRDDFATEIGFAKSYGRGSGALVYHPDGRSPLWCDDLQTAKDVLELYKSQLQ